MKTWVVLAGMVAAVVAATYLYAIKFATPGAQDRLRAGLAGAHKYIKPGSFINYVCMVDEMEAGKEEYHNAHGFVHYIMAPVGLNQKEAHTDTTLVLCPLARAARVRDSMAAHSTVIWQHRDDRYFYLLAH